MSDERVVPGITDISNIQKHIARYNLALAFTNGSVLDLACGTGYGSFILGMVADKVLGVDVSREAIQHARDNYFRENVEYKIGDILDLEVEPVDTIVSFETIEHIKFLDLLQEKFDSLLNPGGNLIYSVPIYENYSNEFHYHKFDPESGLRLFPKYNNQSAVIQKGINFIREDKKEPFTYLVVSKNKPL